MAKRKPNPDDIDSYLPLPASAMHIIVALAGGEKHGEQPPLECPPNRNIVRVTVDHIDWTKNSRSHVVLPLAPSVPCVKCMERTVTCLPLRNLSY